MSNLLKKPFLWSLLKIAVGLVGATAWLGFYLYLVGLPRIADAGGAVAAFLLPWMAVHFLHSLVEREKERRS